MSPESMEQYHQDEVIDDYITSLRYELTLCEKRLKIFQKACNKINDYFEYTSESDEDKAKVEEIFDELTESLFGGKDV